jgi:SAM-dependent methyltransferase
MNEVAAQYEAYPYPERDPRDEAKRLISGSPSHPLEIDHFIYGGRRDWSVPLRALVAGGGTGDGLVQLAQMMAQSGKPCEITYVDLSKAAREIAEARVQARGLTGIRFVTGSLLAAPDLGEFDYIDCCGVLHHLPDPAAGFAALRAALAPGGGMGFMVYAPYGRSGVYPLQEAFGALFEGLPPEARLKKARALLARLPEGHPFKTNPHLNDHKSSDAGFYDLLLHSQDRAFDLAALSEMLDRTGWALSGFTTPALYDLGRITDIPEGMGLLEQMVLAEKLNGTLKTHVGYAVAQGSEQTPASGRSRSLVPHLKGAQPRALAQAVAKGQSPKLSGGVIEGRLHLPADAASLLAAIDGRRTLNEIAAATGTDPIRMGALWGRIEAELGGWGMLLYSSILRR